MKKVVLPVNGMSCVSCANRLTAVMSKTPGIVETDINFALSSAEISYDDLIINSTKIAETIHDCGFEVEPDTVIFTIHGITCAACIARIEKSLSRNDGIISVSVNIANSQAEVVFLPGAITKKEIFSAIEMTGFEPEDIKVDNQKQTTEKELIKLRNRLFISVFLTLPVMWFGMSHNHLSYSVIIQLIASTFVQFVPGWQFYRNTYHSLRHKYVDMNCLIVLGTTAAWGFSIYTVLSGGHDMLYFDSSATIITLILMGKYLELRARAKASDAISLLVKLQPDEAHLAKDNTIYDIPANELVPGDIIIIRPGEKIPADGCIIEGKSKIDEAMLTGEMMPVEKNPDAVVTGGTINISGSLTVKILRSGSNTTLAKIIRMVETAQRGKAPMQRLADKVAGIFVPMVLLIAIVTLVVWLLIDHTQALVHTVSVLIIACPCALGLATPIAIIAGTGRAADYGILIKGGEILEKVHAIKTVIFDKTGTLTEGHPEVDNFTPSNCELNTALFCVAALEIHSEHPLAKAIIRFAIQNGITPVPAENYKYIPSHGATGSIDGVEIISGSNNFFKQNNILLPEEIITGTHTHLAINGIYAGTFIFGDKLREDARITVDELRKMNINTVMLTGDHKIAAEKIAAAAGITEIISEVFPDQKAQVVKDVQKAGIVAMVGDGINDAPALAQADIGISMGDGIDIAVEAGDIALLGNKLFGVITGIKISRKTLLTIKQNLFWAFFYNIIGIPIAAGAFSWAGINLSPIYAAGAMALSSIFVVTNALLLRRYKP